MAEQALELDTIARIGLLFLDGDALAQVLTDPLTADDDDTDYRADSFNSLKKVLMKIERLDPSRYVTGVLWRWHPINRRLAIPAVAGKALPSTGWQAAPCCPELYDALTGCRPTRRDGGGGKTVHYYPVRSAAGDVVGALELTDGGERGPFEERFFNCDPIN